MLLPGLVLSDNYFKVRFFLGLEIVTWAARYWVADGYLGVVSTLLLHSFFELVGVAAGFVTAVHH